ncbi:MAG: MFS transporter [Thiotrichales bacterium]|nr:MFS transporter [Thiotrichales bacterium]
MRGTYIIAVVFSSTAIGVGVSQYAFGLFIVPIEAAFGWSRTEISASLSFAAVSGLTAPFLGRAMDRFGARPVLVFSLAVFGASFCLRPLMTDLWHWYALSLLQFAAFPGLTVLPAGRLVAAWFPHIRGRMMGIVTAGNNVGGLVMPAFIAALFAVMAWDEASVIIGVAAFAIAGVAMLVIREAPPTPEGHARHPGTPGESATAPAAPLPDRNLRETTRTRMFWAVFIAITLGTFTYASILPHVLAHLVNRGMTNASALTVLGTLATAGIGGKLGFGWLAERLGARRLMMVNLAGQAVFAALLALAFPAWMLALATPLFGLFMGGFGVLYILLVQESFGMRHFGSVMGLMNLGTVISYGAGPLIAGVSYDLSGGYGIAFLVTCGLFLTGVVALVFARPRAEPTRIEADFRQPS